MVCGKDPGICIFSFSVKEIINCMKKIFLLVLAVCITVCCFSQARIVLVPVLHGLHKSNQQYNYDSLKNLVVRINPDVVAVEIRQEDINSDTSYLKKNYPYEMWMMPIWLKGKTITGFDWLGKDIEGIPIPEHYWNEKSKIKKLQASLNMDSTLNNALAECNAYNEKRMPLLLNFSLTDILKSNDHSLVKSYYYCLETKLRETEYKSLVDFYSLRNHKMMERISSIINDHPNKTIVVLTGDDHYPYLLDYLRNLNIVLLYP